MIVCPKCKDTFHINDENAISIKKDGQTIGWQHRICPKIKEKYKGELK